ncbi:MAG: hypothetical protein M3R31_04670 [Pseudomonadota bacterium]|nr:hypothetical protein [Pseudomonadota bacterium]
MHTNAYAKITRGIVAMLLCLAPCFAASAADPDDIAVLKRAIAELQEENRALAKRVTTLEAEKAERTAQKDSTGPPVRAESREQERLAERVKDLELAKTAQEEATRFIIQDSMSKIGSKINEAVTFGGQIAVTLDRHNDIDTGERKIVLGSSADLDFEAKVSDWVTGIAKVVFNDGNDIAFLTPTGHNTGVDRLTLELAYLTIGDPQKFPLSLTAGRQQLPFGISTGFHTVDVLSSRDPLTVEAFQMRDNAIGLSLAWPTPKLGPATPGVVVPPVRPMVLAPLVNALGQGLGYAPPPTRPKPLTRTTFNPNPPAYTADLVWYQGSAATGNRSAYGAALGYKAKGHCGRPYEELANSLVCPWTVNVEVNYNSAVFNSLFLRQEYQNFLDQIGQVPGAAASVKASLGPFALVGEWNGAIKHARFVDSEGTAVSIRPSAWQVSLGWQLGWNPWVTEIGQQGSYVAFGYSQSRDLAGVKQLIEGTQKRVGFLPKRRVLLTFGEWVVEGLRTQFEVSREWDYSLSEGSTGSTGRAVNGIIATLTYVW